MTKITVTSNHEGRFVVGHGFSIKVETDEEIVAATKRIETFVATIVEQCDVGLNWVCDGCGDNKNKEVMAQRVTCPGKPVVLLCYKHNGKLYWVDE